MSDADYPKDKSMTKRELVMQIAERLGFAQNEVAEVVQATLDAIVESLAEGRRLEIRNFGVFEVRTRDSRKGRNPRTGEEVPIAQKRVATFKPGKALKEQVRAQGVSDKTEPPISTTVSDSEVEGAQPLNPSAP